METLNDGHLTDTEVILVAIPSCQEREREREREREAGRDMTDGDKSFL